MTKRGQVTIFIIIGIIIVSVSGIGYYLIKNSGTDAPKSQEGEAVYNYIQKCIKDSAANSAYIFGFQQGYYSAPGKALDTPDTSVAYFYYLGKNIVPSNSFFEEQFSKIMQEEILFECTDFSDFENIGYSISYGSPKVDVSINEKSADMKIDFPITINGNNTESFSKFEYSLPFRIGHIIDVSRNLVEELVKNPSSIDLTLLLNQDVKVSVVDYDKCNQIYVINDEKSKFSNEDSDYAFSFGALFSGENCDG